MSVKKYNKSITTGLLMTSIFSNSIANAGGFRSTLNNDALLVSPRALTCLQHRQGTDWDVKYRRSIYEAGITDKKEAKYRFGIQANFWQKQLKSSLYRRAVRNWQIMSDRQKQDFIQKNINAFCKKFTGLEKSGFNKEIDFYCNSYRYPKVPGIYNATYGLSSFNLSEAKKRGDDPRSMIALSAYKMALASNILCQGNGIYGQTIRQNLELGHSGNQRNAHIKSRADAFQPLKSVPNYLYNTVKTGNFNTHRILNGNRNWFFTDAKNPENREIKQLVKNHPGLIAQHLNDDGVFTKEELRIARWQVKQSDPFRRQYYSY